MSNQPHDTHQSHSSIEKNKEFFLGHRHEYNAQVQELDTYVSIRKHVDDAIRGTSRLLDIGNGGVFDYNAALADNIVALDLFVEDVKGAEGIPPNATLKNGSALDIPEADASFDGVLMVMLLHHLVGKTVDESFGNIRQAFREALRVLRPGGKLIVVESCVPPWFFTFERAVFPIAVPAINRLIHHPATLQFPPRVIWQLLKAHAPNVEVTHVPKGKWVLQYGFKFPSALTPVQVYRFVVHKSL